jgi:hypothetical protein
MFCVGSNPIVGKKEKRLCFASFWCCPAACAWGWGRGPRFPCRVRRFESDRGQKGKKVMFCLFLVLPSSLRVGPGSGSTFPMPCASVRIRSWAKKKKGYVLRRFESDRGQKRKKVMFCLILVLPSILRVGLGSGSTFPMPCASVRIRSWAKRKKGYVLPLFGVAQQPARGAGVGVHVSHAVCVGSNPIVGKKEKRLCFASVRIRSWAKKKKGYVLPLFGVAQQPARGAGVGVHVSHAVYVGSNPIVGKKEKRLCFASFWCCPAACAWGWGRGPRFPCRVRRFESDRGQKRKKVMFCLFLVLPSSLRVGPGSGSTFPMPCASVRIRSWAKKKKSYVLRRFESDRGQKRKKVMFCLFLVLPSSLRVGLGSGSTFPMPCASVRIRSWAKKKKGYVLRRFESDRGQKRKKVMFCLFLVLPSSLRVGPGSGSTFPMPCASVRIRSWAKKKKGYVLRRFESDRGQKRKKVMFCLFLVLPSSLRVGLGSGSTFPMPCASVRIRSWAKKKKGYVLPLFGVAQQPARGAGVGVHVAMT